MICKYWFKCVFIPHAIACCVTPEEQILLVFNGHVTYETPEMKELAFKNNILFYSPLRQLINYNHWM